MDGKQLKNSILKEAIQGRLVPQDSSEEPASVLLERIEEERQRLIREKKIKKPKTTSRIFRRDGHFYESVNGGAPVCIDDEIPFDIPHSWEWVRLQDYCVYGEVPSVKVKDCSPNSWVLDLEDIEPHSGCIKQRVSATERSSSSNKYGFAVGMVLYSKLRPYLNKVVVAEESGCCTTEIIPIRLFYEANPYYFQQLLMSSYFVEEINSDAYGVKMPRADTKKIKSFLIPVPPLDEQTRILSKIKELASLVELYGKHQNELVALNRQLPDSLRKSIIQEAIQGKLVPQDDSEEPACVLLERIAEERAKLSKKAAKPMSRIIRRGSETYEVSPDGTEKDISDEIPFEIPNTWEWVRLGELVFSIEAGKNIRCEERPPKHDECGIVKVSSVSRGYFRECESKTCESSQWNPQNAINVDDFLICRANTAELVGACAIVENIEKRLMLSDKVLRLSLSASINAPFILMIMRSPYIRELLIEGATGTSPSMQNISQEFIKTLLLPLPPMGEQLRITKTLETLLAHMSL